MMKYQNIFRITSIILFLGLMCASFAHAQTENYTLVKSWGSYGNGNMQFDEPSGITIDSSGNIYVADTNNNRILKFDNNGTFLTKWDGSKTSSGQMFPLGIAVDSSDNVYVTDASINKVFKFNSNGGFINEFGSEKLDVGTAVAVDSYGNVYVSDQFNHSILIFDSNGNYKTNWNLGSSSYYDSWDIAVDSSGNVYVTFPHLNIVEKFDSNGKYLTNYGSTDNNDGQLEFPIDVAVDSYDNVYIADNKGIHKFYNNGTFITKWGSYNSSGLDSTPYGLAVDSSGNVYVDDSWNNRIQKFAPNPVANFTNEINDTDPLEVQFNDTSTGNATSWYWDFGDGTNSIDENPEHTYDLPGSYQVTLTIQNELTKQNKFTMQNAQGNSNSIKYEIDASWPAVYGFKFGNDAKTSRSPLKYDDASDLPTFVKTFTNIDIINNYPKTNWFYENEYKDLVTYKVGNCFGMAAYSIISQLLNPNHYNDQSFDTAKVQIWYYQSIQDDEKITAERNSYDEKSCVKQVYDYLIKNLPTYENPTRACNNVNVILNIEGHDTKGNLVSHSVVPYYIDDRNPKAVNIYVYDPNAPFTKENPQNCIEALQVNPADGPISDFPINKNPFNINIFKIDLISATSCTSPKIPYDIIKAEGPANLLCSDSIGNYLGYYQGVFKDEIKGSCPLIISAQDDNNSSLQESYYVPDPSIKIELCGNGIGNLETSMITQDGLTTADVPVTPTSVDQLKVLNNGTGFEFIPENGNTPSLDLMLDVESSGSAQVVNTSISQIEVGGSVNLSNNNGNITLQNSGLSRTCNFSLEQTTNSQNSSVSINDIAVYADSTVHVVPSNWNDISNSTISIDDVGSNGTIYYTKTIGQDLRVFPGCTNLSKDLNGDGLYEDINGNGRLDFADVVTYFNNMAWISQNEPITYFDYNRNGRIDFSDVVMLFNMKSS